MAMKIRKSVGLGYGLVGTWVVAAMIIAGCAASAPQDSYAESAAPAPIGGVADMSRESGAAAPVDEAVAQSAGGEGTVASARKIIARASLTLVVADTEATVDDITQLITEMGGYVSTSDLYRGSQSLQGQITLRVPAENLDATLDALGEMAVEVESRSLNREDVTDQYSDVDAQIRNLEATETELRAMLEEVRERPNSTTEDIMAVYRTLTDVRGQIETLRGRKNMWDNLISLSTITVTIRPDSANLPVVEEGWRPSGVAREAQRALVATFQVLGNVAIWLGIFVLPLLLLALIPLGILVWVIRWGIRRLSKAKTTAASPPVPSA